MLLPPRNLENTDFGCGSDDLAFVLGFCVVEVLLDALETILLLSESRATISGVVMPVPALDVLI